MSRAILQVVLVALLVVPSTAARAQRTDNVVDLSMAPEESAQLFAVARTRWEIAFRPERLRGQVERLAEGDQVITADLKNELYLVRKSGAIVRSGFQLLGASHQKPRALDRYVVAAGKLNDAINSGQRERIPKLARRVLAALDENQIAAELRAFVPASRESLEGYLYTSLSYAKKVGKAKKLRAPVFHQLRKEMTNLLVLFDSDQDMPRDTRRLYDRLQRLRFKMGEVHDELVAQEQEGGAYKVEKVKLSKSTRKDIRKAVSGIKRRRPEDSQVHYKRWRRNVKPGRGAKRVAPGAKPRGK